MLIDRDYNEEVINESLNKALKTEIRSQKNNER